MGDEEDACNTGLRLGLGVDEFVPNCGHSKKKQVVRLDLSFPIDTKEEEEAIDVGCYIGQPNNTYSYNNDDDDHHSNKNKKNCSRKKLRLTKEQSTSLEESFKLHTTLNPIQKQTLADKLLLRPRQVEVWFQNRRARTKLKQTEVECELLKKWCKSLSEENRRLKKDLEQLKLFNLDPKPKPPTLALCPSCTRHNY